MSRQSLETGIGRIASSAPGFDRTNTSYAVGAAASWEVDLFGGLRRGRQAALADVGAAQAEVAGARVTVIAEVADAYLQVRLLQRRIDVLQQQVSTADHLNRLVELRFAAGIVARQETDRANAQAQQFRASLPLLEALLLVQMNRLDVLMGTAPGTHRSELGRPGNIPAAPGIVTAQGPVELLRRRPDILAAERRLAAASARIGEAVAEYYPKVSLRGLLGLEALGAGRLLSDDAAAASGVLGLRWRLFDFGRIDAAVAAARGAEREALIAYRQSVLRALQDVENGMSMLVRREAQARALSEAEASLRRARASVGIGYAAGATSLVEVLDVERQLLATQDEVAQAQGEASRAAVATFRALGGGWS
jgi:NodT family efflux transporter outer membrane factor (OMF) lipoprotein